MRFIFQLVCQITFMAYDPVQRVRIVKSSTLPAIPLKIDQLLPRISQHTFFLRCKMAVFSLILN